MAVRRARPPSVVRPGRAGAEPADRHGPALARASSSSRPSGRGSPTATSFPPSRRLAEALEPSNDPVIVARGLDETDQARALLEERPGVGIGAAHDIGPADRAGGPRRPPGARPVPRDRRRRSTRRRGWPRSSPTSGGRSCASSARELHALPALRSTLARSFDPVGELLDTASPRLGGLRAAVRVAYDRLRRRLDSLVGSELGNALQEPIITLRNGRYVVPVKAEARSRVKGIVHDASGSGQTLFIEPLVAVELGNAWREAQVAEAEEIARILDELSAFVAANADRAARDARRAGPVRPLGGQGVARRARWAPAAPRPPTGPRSILLSARHPGLTGRVVPIDIRLGDGYTALVVTGPNTGGKTVTLRTLGLLSLMHQAGLHVPAEPGSRLPIWRDVFADIGDEQSIAQSLSTFSGHLRSIIRIVEAAGPGTLVLLDELGAGTDPTEGSALAQALLDHFIRAGALVAATTHYAELKAYAHTTPEARNAAVEFDLETLSPTYRLTIGLPGGSQAFAIAERLGLPEPIVDRRPLAPVRVAALVRGDPGLDQGDRGRDQRGARPGAGRRAAGHRGAAGRPGGTPPRPAGARRRGSRAHGPEAERIVDDLRTEVRHDARGARTRDGHRARRSTRRSPGPRRRSSGCRPRRAGRRRGGAVVPRTWRLGERARSRSGGWEGRIAALERGGKRATLEAGGMRVTVETDDLDPGDSPNRPQRGTRGGGRRGGRRLERLRAPPRAGALGRVVARPARGARGRGARRAQPLPRRCGAGRPRQGPDHPRDGHGRRPRRGPQRGRRATRW